MPWSWTSRRSRSCRLHRAPDDDWLEIAIVANEDGVRQAMKTNLDFILWIDRSRKSLLSPLESALHIFIGYIPTSSNDQSSSHAVASTANIAFPREPYHPLSTCEVEDRCSRLLAKPESVLTKSCFGSGKRRRQVVLRVSLPLSRTHSILKR